MATEYLRTIDDTFSRPDAHVCAVLSGIAYDDRSKEELERVINGNVIEQGGRFNLSQYGLFRISEIFLNEKSNIKVLFVELANLNKRYIVFRGTVPSIENVQEDINQIPSDYTVSGYKSLRVPHGFNYAYLSVRRKIGKFIRDLSINEGEPKPDLYITGHSLGGAITAIAGWDIAMSAHNFRSKFRDIKLYTIGSPAFVNMESALYFNANSIGRFDCWHIIDPRDPVPQLSIPDAFRRFRDYFKIPKWRHGGGIAYTVLPSTAINDLGGSPGAGIINNIGYVYRNSEFHGSNKYIDYIATTLTAGDNSDFSFQPPRRRREAIVADVAPVTSSLSQFVGPLNGNILKYGSNGVDREINMINAPDDIDWACADTCHVNDFIWLFFGKIGTHNSLYQFIFDSDRNAFVYSQEWDITGIPEDAVTNQIGVHVDTELGGALYMQRTSAPPGVYEFNMNTGTRTFERNPINTKVYEIHNIPQNVDLHRWTRYVANRFDTAIYCFEKGSNTVLYKATYNHSNTRFEFSNTPALSIEVTPDWTDTTGFCMYSDNEQLHLLALGNNFEQNIKFQATNAHDHYLRHESFRACLRKKDGTNTFDTDTSFKKVNGLCGQGVSFESVNFPNYYLIHEFFQIKMVQYRDDLEYKKGASFKQVAGLNLARGYSFESVNFPNHFIRYRNSKFDLVLNDNTPTFTHFATFNMTGLLDPLVSFHSLNFQNYFLLNNTGNAILERNDGGEEFIESATFQQVSGVSGQGVSFESIVTPGSYIVIDNFEVKIQPLLENDEFKRAASFWIRPGLVEHGGYSLESVQHSGQFIRHEMFRFVLKPNNGNIAFAQSATFDFAIDLRLVLGRDLSSGV